MIDLLLPEGWCLKFASDILDVRDGTHDTPRYVEKGVPLVTSKNLKGGKIIFDKISYITFEDHQEISKRSGVKEGDVLFAMIGTIGNPVVVKGNSEFSIKNVGLFKKNPKVIDSNFLCYFLSSKYFERQLLERQLLKGTTQKFIPLGHLRDLQISLPPLPEQHRIVAKIEELFSELDKGIETLKTAKQQLKVYRQAVLKYAFEGNKSSVVWKRDSLKNAAIKIVVGYVGPVTQYIVKENGIIFLSTTHIGENEFLNHDIRFISKSFDSKNLKSHVIPGDILIARHGDSGKACVVPDYIQEAQVSNAVILRPDNKKIITKFLCFRLNYERQRMQSMKVGGVQQVVNTKSMEAFEVDYPSIDIQEKIVQEIESRLSVCDKIEESIEQGLQQAEALRQSILKKAFEGKLVPQDPKDEPASVLLERIKAERANVQPEKKTKIQKAKA